MADAPKPLQFNVITRPEDRRSDASLPAPKTGPWSANLPMNEDRAQRMRAALAKHGDGETLRQFDNEMKDKNIPQAEEATLALDRRKSGLHSAAPSDYHPDLTHSTLDPDAQGRVSTELNQMMSELRFQPGLGATLTEQLAEIGPRYQRMSPSERTNWEAKQTELLTKLSGGASEVPKVRELARAALRRASGEFPKRLAGSGIMASALLTLSLANQERYFAAYENLRKRRR
jgi:hypothetical protein